MQKILLGCRILEFLKMHHCSGENTFSKLSISSSSLIELVVEYVSGNMEISAPNLRSLSLLWNMGSGRFKVINDLSSLEEVNLSFTPNTFFGSWLNEFLSKVFHAQKLTIGNWLLQVLSLMELQYSLPSLLSKCTSLTLNTRINERHFPGITNMLQRSPHLEKLTIINTIPSNITEDELEFSRFHIEEEQHWASTQKNFNYLI